MMTLLSAIVAQTTVDHGYDLTAGGWTIMLLSVGFVTLLTGFCIRRVMRESSPQKLHSQVDVDTRDTNDG